MHMRARTPTNLSPATPARSHGVCVRGSVGKPPEGSTGAALRHHGNDVARGLTTTTIHGSVGKAPTESACAVSYPHGDHSATPTGLPSAPLSAVVQRTLLLGILESFAEDAADLVSYLGHVGFDAGALRSNRDLPAAWLGHYRRAQADYDVDRACRDLATWPPIATRIRELQHQAAPSPEISEGSPDDL